VQAEADVEPDFKERSLTSALRAVAQADQTLGASPAVEARLLAEVRSIRRARRRGYIAACSLAVLLLLAVLFPMWRPIARPSSNVARAAVAEGTEVRTDFLPLVYGAMPAKQLQLVRIAVPRKALASFGLGSLDAPRTPADTVLADVLVGEDGLARAVRFVQPIKQQEQR
jgi:hypothetical protein